MSFIDDLRSLIRADSDFRDDTPERLRSIGNATDLREAKEELDRAHREFVVGTELVELFKMIAEAYGQNISHQGTTIYHLQNDPAGWELVRATYFEFQPRAIGANLVRFCISMKAKINPFVHSGVEYRALYLPPERRIHRDPRTDQVHRLVTYDILADPSRVARIIKCLAVKPYKLGKEEQDRQEICGGVNF